MTDHEMGRLAGQQSTGVVWLRKIVEQELTTRRALGSDFLRGFVEGQLSYQVPGSKHYGPKDLKTTLVRWKNRLERLGLRLSESTVDETVICPACMGLGHNPWQSCGSCYWCGGKGTSEMRGYKVAV